jgi:preprotein translocase subunit SecE
MLFNPKTQKALRMALMVVGVLLIASMVIALVPLY